MTTPRSASSRAIATGGLVLLASALLPAAPAVADTVGGMPPALPALPAGWKSYSNVGFDMYTGEWPLSNMPYGTPPEVMPVLLDVYASRDTLSAPGQVSEFVVTLRRTPDYYPYPVADPERAGITRTNFEAVIDLSSAVDDIDALNVDDFEISSGWEGMNVSYENGILNLSGTFAEGRDILTVGFSTTYRASGDNRLQIGAGASFLRIPIPGSDIGSNTHYGTALAAVAPFVVAEPDLSVVAAADKVTVGPGRTPVTYTVDVTRPVGSTVESFRIEDALQELADDVDLTTLRSVTLTGADSPNVEQDGSTLRAQGRFSGPLGQASTARLSFTVDYVGGGDGTLRNAASVAATSHVPEYSWVPVRLAHSAFTTPATAEELDKRPLHPQFGRETPGASAVVTALTATPTVPSTTPSVTPTPTSSATPTPTPSPTPGEPPIATPTVPASEAPTPEPESTAPPTTTTPASSATPSPDASPAPSTEVTTALATSPAQSEPAPVGSSDSSRTPDANGTRPEDGDEVTPSTTPEQELATTGAAAGPLLGWAVGASAAGALAVAASRSSHRRRH